MRSRTSVFLMAAGIIALAGSPGAAAKQVPVLTGRVNDLAGLLSPATRTELEATLKAHEEATSNQVAVLIVAGLEGESLEGYSLRVAETWKLGQRGKDNGVLLLVARDDRQVRIEVGYGLEGTLTDAECGAIIRNDIVPRFRDGDYDSGVRAGVTGILQAIQGAYIADTDDEGGNRAERAFGFLFFLLVVGIFTFFGLVSKGSQTWFLYVFLIPFWGLFPFATLGKTAGLAVFGIYLVGFPAAKLWLRRSDQGQLLLDWAERQGFSGTSSTSGWSGSSSGWSSGGGSFSGGGGSFGGGGASGRW